MINLLFILFYHLKPNDELCATIFPTMPQRVAVTRIAYIRRALLTHGRVAIDDTNMNGDPNKNIKKINIINRGLNERRKSSAIFLIIENTLTLTKYYQGILIIMIHLLF